MPMKAIAAKITFLRTEEGGRSQPIPVMNVGCPVYIEGVPELSEHAYDCRLLISKLGKPISPGDVMDQLSIAFLSPDKVIPYLHKGTRLTLWEGKTIACGEVVSLDV
ncbi:hypothetical protein [Candidatus Entotheonella palauensis]|nr:hypothetical protein [Candidatus Entotheonella palauensis]